KPSNLLLTPSGQVKILDLGLACFQQEHHGQELTLQSRPAGTREYAAPEQCRAGPAADHRADLYSLGCTLYYLLVGHAPPRDALSLSKLSEPTGPPHAGRTQEFASLYCLEAVLKKLLVRDPAHRFASAAEVIDALQPFIEPANGCDGNPSNGGTAPISA